MVEELLRDIQELDEDEFDKFRLYHANVAEDFMTQRYPGNGLEEARENSRKLAERGGSALYIGRLEILLDQANSPEECSREIKEYIERSDDTETIEATMEELMTPFFDEEKDLDYGI